MSPVPFTQYLRPDGRTRRVTLDRPADVAALAASAIAAGVRFEAEVLMTGHVSFEAVRDADDGEVESLASEIVENGPAVLEAVDRLVRAAALAAAQAHGIEVKPMKPIANPQTLAERIVNAVVADIYGRAGGDWWFDSIEDGVRDQEVIPELIAVVQRELDGKSGSGVTP